MIARDYDIDKVALIANEINSIVFPNNVKYFEIRARGNNDFVFGKSTESINDGKYITVNSQTFYFSNTKINLPDNFELSFKCSSNETIEILYFF